MKPHRLVKLATPLLVSGLVFCGHGAKAAEQPKTVVELWPSGAPGANTSTATEADTTAAKDRLVAGKPVIRLGNVTKPTLTIFPPPREKDTGAAVLVCPGGGYNILAMDLEGTEICDWLNSIGITGALLKYRVPKPKGEQRSPAALQDAQRALSLLRSRAADFGIDPTRIGVMGFSAGGHLAAVLSNSREQHKYPELDAADKVSSRPDFCILIYPAYLTVKEANDKIAPELTLSSNTPPTFIAMAQDDPIRVETALFYAAGLRQAGVPFELHIYPTGGHGYGLRRTQDAVTTWPERANDWMRSRKLLERPKTE
jgi:acetyl esterase/lipase